MEGADSCGVLLMLSWKRGLQSNPGEEERKKASSGKHQDDQSLSENRRILADCARALLTHSRH